MMRENGGGIAGKRLRSKYMGTKHIYDFARRPMQTFYQIQNYKKCADK